MKLNVEIKRLEALRRAAEETADPLRKVAYEQAALKVSPLLVARIIDLQNAVAMMGEKARTITRAALDVSEAEE